MTAKKKTEAKPSDEELATLPAKNDLQTKLEHSAELDAAAATDLTPTGSEATFVPETVPVPEGDQPRFAGEVDAALYAQAKARFG